MIEPNEEFGSFTIIIHGLVNETNSNNLLRFLGKFISWTRVYYHLNLIFYFRIRNLILRKAEPNLKFNIELEL